MSTKNHDLAKAHKAAFRQRRKNGLQAVAKPWDWLSLAEVKEMALRAYYVASHGLVEDVQGDSFDVQELRQVFAMNLADLMRDLVLAQAVTRGGCWPVDAGTRHTIRTTRKSLLTCAPTCPLTGGRSTRFTNPPLRPMPSRRCNHDRAAFRVAMGTRGSRPCRVQAQGSRRPSDQARAPSCHR